MHIAAKTPGKDDFVLAVHLSRFLELLISMTNAQARHVEHEEKEVVRFQHQALVEPRQAIFEVTSFAKDANRLLLFINPSEPEVR